MKLLMLLILVLGANVFSFAQVNELPLAGKTVAVLTADSTHDQEALMPIAFLQAQGAEVLVVSNYIGKVNCYNSDLSFYTQKLLKQCKVSHFDALLIPGGHAPAKLRIDEDVVNFVKDFAESGKVLAAICHGPQLLVSAGLLVGQTATCVNLMKHEYETAGIVYSKEHVVVSNNIVTGKGPKSVPQWCVAVKNELLK